MFLSKKPMKLPKTPISTKLETCVYIWLKKEAKRTGRSQSNIIETALREIAKPEVIK